MQLNPEKISNLLLIISFSYFILCPSLTPKNIKCKQNYDEIFIKTPLIKMPTYASLKKTKTKKTNRTSACSLA